MLKDNSLKIFQYIKEHADEDMTSADIAAGVGMEKRSVDSTITALKKYYDVVEREEVPVMGGVVKYIRLTEKGRTYEFATEEN